MAAAPPPPTDWTLEHSIMHLLHRASQAAEDRFSRSIAIADITPRQFAVLAAVANDPNLSQTGLVLQTGIDRSTMADIVRRLVRNGLLTRSRTQEDARAYAIRLTPRAQKIVTQVSRMAVEAERGLLEPLSEMDRTHLVDLLRTLVHDARLQANGGEVVDGHDDAGRARAMRP